ncbi:hypothetical protein MNBD_NITROSPINAE02-264 [hydrothermal vent metagenome]|uniref:Porin domain-containing protein n=1 Tax=hydrothermal vent metagenome TaxID=652676 RepID=A0A3B1D077_9ZZZZ
MKRFSNVRFGLLAVFVWFLIGATAVRGAAATVWKNDDSRFVVGGDARLKIDSASDDGDRETNGWRVRLRVNGEFTANEYVSAGFRLVTSSGDNRSIHGALTVGDGGEEKTDFGVDRAYLRFKADGYYLWAGKNRINIWNPAQFLWDRDIQPEGVALGYKARDGKSKIGIGLGLFAFNKSDWGDNDYLLTYQAAFAVGDNLRIKGALGGLAFNDADQTQTGWIAGAGPDGIDKNNRGRIPGGSSNITHAMVELKSADISFTPRIGFAYAVSDVSDYWGKTNNSTTGGARGANLEQKDKQAFITYFRAVVEGVDIRAYYWDVGYAGAPALGMFGQDEFPLASNFTGYHVQAGYEVAKNISVELRYSYQETKNRAISVWNSGVAMEGEMELEAYKATIAMRF